MAKSYFLDFKKAFLHSQKECGGHARVYSLAVGPQDNVEQLVREVKKKKLPGTAVLVYKDEENWISSRFEILDL